MNSEHPLLPTELNALCQCIAAESGINLDTAALLILEAHAVACGDLIQIRTPDRIDLSPSFHLALVSNGLAFARGALTRLIEPLLDDSEITKEQRDEKGIKQLKTLWEANLRDRSDLARSIAGIEAELAALDNPTTVMERIWATTNNPFNVEKLRERQQQQIAEDRARIAEIDEFIDRIGYYLHPDIIANEPRWRDLNSLATGSFDQNALALCFSNEPCEIQQMSPAERQRCADALKHAKRGKPGVTVIACADEVFYAALLSQRAVRNSGILHQFLFAEVSANVETDPISVDVRAVLEPFHALLMKQFDQRVIGTKQKRRICFPDERGRRADLDMRKWVHDEQKNCAPQIAPFFTILPDIALQLALGRTVMEGMPEGHFFNGEFVERSVEFLKVLGRRQRILLERLIMPQTDDEAQEAMIEKVIGRLKARGPLTKRGLVRTFHHQDYGQVETFLNAAVTRGRVHQHGEFYHAQDVSVSASATS